MGNIESDGTIFPTIAPQLCLGLAPYSNLCLVNRRSPNKAIFKNFLELEYSRSTASKNTAETLILGELGDLKDATNGTSLELSSHPERAIGMMFDTGLTHMQLSGDYLGWMGLTPIRISLAAKMLANNRIVIVGGKCAGAAFCTPA